MKKLAYSVALVGLTGFAGPALAATELLVQYPYPKVFDATQQQIAEKFMAENPDIVIKFGPAYENYEDAAQTVLRQAITGDMPDITFQGLNQFRLLSDRGLAVELKPFIEGDVSFGESEIIPAMLNVGAFGDKIYSLPFAISTPIAYYNLDLVEKAGGDPNNLPKTWDEVFALAQKIEALGDGNEGMWLGWSITGNWFWQSLVFSQGGGMLTPDETKVAFDGPEGQAAMDLLARMVTEGGMPNMDDKAAVPLFSAGKLGVLFWSTARLATIEKDAKDKFRFATAPMPSVVADKGRLPAGGAGVVMLTQDPEKQQAAWRYIKYLVGPHGSTMMTKGTGYMPPSQAAVSWKEFLGDFYASSPNHLTSVKQLNVMTGWYAFPGENSLKIVDVIKDHLQSVASGNRAAEAQAVLQEMARDVQALLPK